MYVGKRSHHAHERRKLKVRGEAIIIAINTNEVLNGIPVGDGQEFSGSVGLPQDTIHFKPLLSVFYDEDETYRIKVISCGPNCWAYT